MCTNNCSNIERSNKVIAQIKWCSFFASQCRTVIIIITNEYDYGAIVKKLT